MDKNKYTTEEIMAMETLDRNLTKEELIERHIDRIKKIANTASILIAIAAFLAFSITYLVLTTLRQCGA